MQHRFLTCDSDHKHMEYIQYNILYLEAPELKAKLKWKNIQVPWDYIMCRVYCIILV